MIKYTILYKNGKTWNGKVKYFSDVPATDCLCVIFREGDTVYATTPYQHMVTGWHWNTPKFVGYSLTGYTRTPNPKSKTKKQKALEDGYHRWVRDWHHRGSSDITMQAYKKWLFHQRLEKPLTKVAGALPEYKVALYTNAEAGYTSPNNIKITAMLPSDISEVDTKIQLSYGEPDKDGFIPWNGGDMPVPDDTKVEAKFRTGSLHLFDHPQDFWWGRDVYEWHCDIVAYKLYEVEPKLEKITFPSGASVSFHDSKDVLKGCKECYVSHEPWDGVYKPWKEAKLSIPDYPLPIKTTYSFWLGAFGEVADV